MNKNQTKINSGCIASWDSSVFKLLPYTILGSYPSFVSSHSFPISDISKNNMKVLIMKTLLIYVSVHHGNTEKVAKVMTDRCSWGKIS